MSSRSSKILTDDNEHWYSDCSEYDGPNGENPMYVEFEKKNIEIVCNDDEELVIRIAGNTHLARIIETATFDEGKARNREVWAAEREMKRKKS